MPRLKTVILATVFDQIERIEYTQMMNDRLQMNICRNDTNER